MTNYKLNIGLNNNNLSKLVENLNNYRGHLFNDYNVNLSHGEYKGVKEFTAVISMDALNYSYENIEKICKSLCRSMDQEFIAVSLYRDNNGQNNGLLIYSDTYKGERDIFNSSYFLN